MALSYSGVDTNLNDLRRRVHVPDRNGSLQLELVAATRQARRVAYVIEAHPANLYHQLADRRPVIVLQNLGTRWLPIWHYAVVVGYTSASDEFVMRSGNTDRRTMGRREFTRRWSASSYWGLVVLNPKEVPTSARPLSYLQAVSAHESLEQWDIAQSAYRAAIQRWPDDPYAHLAVGNVNLQLGSMREAINAFETALRLDSTNLPALNNLAFAYARNSDNTRALAMIERALAQAITDDGTKADLMSLRATLQSEE